MGRLAYDNDRFECRSVAYLIPYAIVVVIDFPACYFSACSCVLFVFRLALFRLALSCFLLPPFPPPLRALWCCTYYCYCAQVLNLEPPFFLWLFSRFAFQSG